MIALKLDKTGERPRRSFFGRLAGAAALGLIGLTPAALGAEPAAVRRDSLEWPGKLKGRHRQMVDAYAVNSGRPLEFTYAFLATNPSPGEATAIVVLRSQALLIALSNKIWERYKLGESFELVDPETKELAVKNPFLHPKSGVLPSDEMAIDRLLEKGVMIGACNMALHGLSNQLASNAGVTADEAAREWAENLLPGITLLSSGVWGVNRAQEAGCTYCAGGG